jgi:formylglycine-generating enzyme required for sulfatase activity
MQYRDFDLKIIRLSPGQFRAEGRAPDGATGVVEFPQPLSELELENFILRIGRTRTGLRKINSPQMEAAEKFGRKLFDAVFVGELRDCFTAAVDALERDEENGLRLRLRLTDAPELASLPWEYLYYRKHFIVLSRETPLVRSLDVPRSVRPLVVTPPLRFVGMVSDPKDSRYAHLDVEKEKANINNALRDLVANGLFKVEWLHTATLAELQRRLRQKDPVHIFHFIGHGGWDEAKEDGLLVFHDDYGDGYKVGASHLATILSDHPSLRLVTLNACEGARLSPTDPFAGVAATLVGRNVPAVLAMQFEITDRAAIQLSQMFYESLADGLPVEGALAEARKAIFASGNDVEWGTPVLYLRAKEGLLFDVKPTRTPIDSDRLQAAHIKAKQEEWLKAQSPPPAATEKTKEAAQPGASDALWVTIPAGEFLFGDKKEKRTLPAFQIMRYPVTNAQYAEFVTATGHRPPVYWRDGLVPAEQANHPVTNVNWHDAQDYCAWANVRLPTEEEWEKAARGTDGRDYPWGNDWPDATRCNFNYYVGGTTPVGKYSPHGDSPYGCADMAGNVWEWTTTRQPNKATFVLCGGSWNFAADLIRTTTRFWFLPHTTGSGVGFRCVRSP